MVVIVRKHKSAPASVESVEIKPVKKPVKKEAEKKPGILKPGYYYKAFPNVDRKVICAFFYKDRVSLDLVRRCLKDTSACHTAYFLYFIKAVQQVGDPMLLMKIKKKERWKYITDNYDRAKKEKST